MTTSELRQPSLNLSPSLPRQKTFVAPFLCSGIGVHSATQVTLNIIPAEPNHGIQFLRIDQPDVIARIPAHFKNVVSTIMSTTLANEHGLKVSTVEHLLSAFAGVGITNAVIEIDGPELPIMDGSSRPYLERIKAVGIQGQEAPVRAIEILKPIQIQEGNALAELIPHQGRLISFTWDENSPFYKVINGEHSLTFDMNLNDYAEIIAPSRTFGFYEDGQKLIAAGLAKGASLENTLVFRDEKLMNEEGLRSPDEIIRHKILDAIGDLALSGVVIYGHFKGINSGHGLNNKLLHTLFQTPEAWRIIEL